MKLGVQGQRDLMLAAVPEIKKNPGDSKTANAEVNFSGCASHLKWPNVDHNTSTDLKIKKQTKVC